MIKIELEIENIDYDTLIRRYLPQLKEELCCSGGPAAALLSGTGGDLAARMIAALPEEKKDALACQLLNANRHAVQELAEKAAAGQGVRLSVTGLRAEAKK